MTDITELRNTYKAEANARACLIKILVGNTYRPFSADARGPHRIADVTAFDDQSFHGLDCFLCRLGRQDSVVVHSPRRLPNNTFSNYDKQF